MLGTIVAIILILFFGSLTIYCLYKVIKEKHKVIKEKYFTAIFLAIVCGFITVLFIWTLTLYPAVEVYNGQQAEIIIYITG